MGPPIYLRRIVSTMKLTFGQVLDQPSQRLLPWAGAHLLVNMARLVHFGATIGTFIRQALGNKTIGTDVFIGCGVAAAIAAGFHAPIAGIVFAHEAVLRHFSFRALTPIAIKHHISLVCNGYFWR